MNLKALVGMVLGHLLAVSLKSSQNGSEQPSFVSNAVPQLVDVFANDGFSKPNSVNSVLGDLVTAIDTASVIEPHAAPHLQEIKNLIAPAKAVVAAVSSPSDGFTAASKTL